MEGLTWKEHHRNIFEHIFVDVNLTGSIEIDLSESDPLHIVTVPLNGVYSLNIENSISRLKKIPMRVTQTLEKILPPEVAKLLLNEGQEGGYIRFLKSEIALQNYEITNPEGPYRAKSDFTWTGFLEFHHIHNPRIQQGKLIVDTTRSVCEKLSESL